MGSHSDDSRINYVNESGVFMAYPMFNVGSDGRDIISSRALILSFSILLSSTLSHILPVTNVSEQLVQAKS